MTKAQYVKFVAQLTRIANHKDYTDEQAFKAILYRLNKLAGKEVE